MDETRREVEIVVISDIHLGTFGSHAKELVRYLKTINPKTLILNGDIIDIWEFKKSYWPNSHMKVVKHILNFAAKGTQVYYITGNHDETLRKFAGAHMGNFSIINQLQLNLDEKRVWFFHGDVFDIVMQHSRWLAIIGSISYDILIRLNYIINSVSAFLGKGKISFAKKIKDNVKSAVKYINNFEVTASHIAVNKGFDYIVCGHIHHAENRMIELSHGKSIHYLNSGDWIENLTALEYNNKQWSIYHYPINESVINDLNSSDESDAIAELNNKEIFNLMLKDFQE